MFSPEEMGRDELTIAVNGRGFVNVSGVNTRLSEYVTDMIPLQSTGLVDKKGVEIFVGDIMTWFSRIAQVRFNVGTFCIDDGHSPNTHYFTCPIGNYTTDGIVSGEVLGNIYENPELLTE